MRKAIRYKSIECRFIGNFKVGDNLDYNTNILCELFRQNKTDLLNKPITLQAGAIIEACLQQIIFRAQNFNREGVPNISEEDRQEIEGKKIEKFAVILSVMKKYKILDRMGDDIYDELDKLRKIRNKIHIQDFLESPKYPRDEDKLFTALLRDLAISLLTRILLGLNEDFPRPENLKSFATKLKIPLVG